MKTLFQNIFIALLMHILLLSTPLLAMEKQPSTIAMQKCNCGTTVQLRRLSSHIYAQHVIVVKGIKKYICPNCPAGPFHQSTDVITHLELVHALPVFDKSIKSENDESTTDMNDFWNIETNNGSISKKASCLCGRVWSHQKKGQLQHINNYHFRCVDYKKTFICPKCTFTAQTVELIWEHNKTHTANNKQALSPIKKIKKPNTPSPILLSKHIANLPNKTNDFLDKSLVYGSETLEELFPTESIDVINLN